MRKFSGQKVAEARKSRGLRHEHLAVTLNRTASTLARYESGAILPTADLVGALADALEVSVDDLYEISTIEPDDHHP